VANDVDPGDLSRLNDIVEPTPVSWWPPAPGWYVLAGVASVLLATAAWVAFSRWRRNRYRREALKLLETMPKETTSLPQVAELLKRVALAAYPRESVASLHGIDWWKFLDESGQRVLFSNGTGKLMEDAVYRPNQVSATSAELTDLFVDVRYWITNHRC
jgi:hypothetical protein